VSQINSLEACNSSRSSIGLYKGAEQSPTVPDGDRKLRCKERRTSEALSECHSKLFWERDGGIYY
jgi:hypothetical protein